VQLQESDNAVTFCVRVHPRARKNVIIGEIGDALKNLSDCAPSRGARQ
jgi:hypothetical protein